MKVLMQHAAFRKPFSLNHVEQGHIFAILFQSYVKYVLFKPWEFIYL